MAESQHKDARRILALITKSLSPNGKVSETEYLTYGEVAKTLGVRNPSKSGRSIGQKCDLLDAAACLAGVPLLALVAVRDVKGQINPKAWKEYAGPRRDAIIKHSKEHRFTRADLNAINEALDTLYPRGRERSWRYLNTVVYGPEKVYERLVGQYQSEANDAINDLETDGPDRARQSGYRYVRNSKVRKAVIARAKGRCEYCKATTFRTVKGEQYLEAHHIIALAKDGRDELWNVIALCPSDHRRAHYGKDAAEIEEIMIKVVRDKIDLAQQNSRPNASPNKDGYKADMRSSGRVKGRRL